MKRQAFLRTAPPKNSFDALILDAESRQALVTIQSLGVKGLRLAAIANINTNAPALSSRWCLKAISSPFPEGTDAYIQFLISFLSINRVRVLIPCSDGTIALLRKYRKDVEKLTSIALASESALRYSVNKTKTLDAAKKLGIPVPRSITIATYRQLLHAVKTLSFPVVVKPAQSWLKGISGTKRMLCMFAKTPEKVFAAWEAVAAYKGEVILQEYLTGPREAVSIVYARKKIYAKFAQYAKRTQPPLGGTSVLRQSIEVPDDIGIFAEKLIRGINIEGYSEVEFRRDAKGTAYLMEINPRLSMSVDIAIRTGVDFPYLLFQWASGEKIDTSPTYVTGKWERYLAGDFIATIQTLQENRQAKIFFKAKILTDFFYTFLHPMYYDYITWLDLKPAWIATSDFIVRNMKKSL